MSTCMILLNNIHALGAIAIRCVDLATTVDKTEARENFEAGRAEKLMDKNIYNGNEQRALMHGAELEEKARAQNL